MKKYLLLHLNHQGCHRKSNFLLQLNQNRAKNNIDDRAIVVCILNSSLFFYLTKKLTNYFIFNSMKVLCLFFCVLLINGCFGHINVKFGNKNFTDEATLEMMKENLLISYTPNCFPKELQNWTCYWCKKLKTKMKVVEYLSEPNSYSFGFIAETEKESLNNFY